MQVHLVDGTYELFRHYFAVPSAKGTDGVEVGAVKRFWLHQANLGMNKLIAKKLLGRDPEPEEAPVILDEYANTSSAGSVIAFHKHRDGIAVGDLGVLCSFGAGYSVGSVLLRKHASE